MERQAGHRIHAPSLVRRGRRVGGGRPDPSPVFVGGQIGEWLAGLFGAIGTLAARRRGGAQGELIDVSMLEAQAMCLTYYPVTFNDQLGRPMRRKRFVASPGVGAASDGLVGLGCGTGQQWLDFCVLVGHPEWMEDRSLFLDRTALAPTIDAWVADHTVEEVLHLASAFRIPNAPITNGVNATTWAHFQERGTFVANPRDGAVNPQPPVRLSAKVPAARSGASSRRPVDRGGHDRREGCPERDGRRRGSRALPFAGLRGLDMTSFWAGPLTGHLLALLGAEVVHLESSTRPDGARLVGGVPRTEDQYLGAGPHLRRPQYEQEEPHRRPEPTAGVDLVRRFVTTCDVVVENYTPRVLEQLGLDFESLRTQRPDLIMMRMPGFGLDGPWRDLSAFAFVIEDAAGLTWMTGHPDLLPFEPYCVGDPNAGLHALYGLLLALEHRQATGEGGLVEAAMVDAALNIAAEQMIESSAYGSLLGRDGNRGPAAAPQNLYQVAGPDERGRDDGWVAIAVATDEQWGSLFVGRSAYRNGRPILHVGQHDGAGFRRASTALTPSLAEWCAVPGRRTRVVEVLCGEPGVPVGKGSCRPHDQPELPQARLRAPILRERGSPRHRSLPVQHPAGMRFSRGPERIHRRHAPLLGEHNGELLGELGLSTAEIDALEADGIIGGSPSAQAPMREPVAGTVSLAHGSSGKLPFDVVEASRRGVVGALGAHRGGIGHGRLHRRAQVVHQLLNDQVNAVTCGVHDLTFARYEVLASAQWPWTRSRRARLEAGLRQDPADPAGDRHQHHRQARGREARSPPVPSPIHRMRTCATLAVITPRGRGWPRRRRGGSERHRLRMHRATVRAQAGAGSWTCSPSSESERQRVRHRALRRGH